MTNQDLVKFAPALSQAILLTKAYLETQPVGEDPTIAEFIAELVYMEEE